MVNDKAVAEHYVHGDLLNAIQSSLAKLGKTINDVTIEDLAPMDEFHIGGRMATENFLSQLNFSEQHHVLDIGCGLGGASRYVVSKYNNRVSGIDLTQEYIDTGNALCGWVKMDRQVKLHQGSALSMPFDDNSFDGAYMMHVGMNIEDKQALFNEVSRVLKPGAALGIYDVMRINEGELSYPVPWAASADTSRLATLEQYKEVLGNAGFEVSKENNRRDFAMEFFKQLRAKTEANGGPPPLGLHTLMKETTATKIKNMIDNINADYVAPVEIIACKV